MVDYTTPINPRTEHRSDNDHLATMSSARKSKPLVKHDSNLISPVPDVIYIGTSGTIIGQLVDDKEDRVFKDLDKGYHSLSFKLIKTSSTAADIVALY